MTLMPVSTSLRWSTARRTPGLGDGWRELLGVDRAELVDRLAEYVEHPASVARPTGMVITLPVSMAFMPRTMPLVATIAMQAHAAFAQMLLDLEDDGERLGYIEPVADDAQRLVNGRHRLLFETARQRPVR